jgi:6-phosphogluconate dehydrogenase
MISLADVGLIGLAVMGENLVLNMESKGFTVALYNRSVQKVVDFLHHRGKNKRFIGSSSIKEFVMSIKTPRKVMMLVKAGRAVDEIIDQLLPFLEPGDVIIDGGNSYFSDTIRRTAYVESKGLLYVGAGVSGGEEGALNGPSIMPGGSLKAWELVKPLFTSIAARVEDGSPCCDWVGENGAGHFVKMVHNGIEYGDMQLIGEVYQMLRDVAGMNNNELHETFSEWNRGELNSYLIEITANIFAYRDDKGDALVDKILDAAGQKGTGKWTGIEALELGVPLSLIVESVFARALSSLKEVRVHASAKLAYERPSVTAPREQFIEDLRQALYASKIVSYAQGFALLSAAAENYRWNLNLGSIALMWRGGCIIRSAFLQKIKNAYDADRNLQNLMLDPYFCNSLLKAQAGWRRVIATAALQGIPVPALAAALAYFDGFRSARLPANLLQAQRDYFGAHTYERIDRPRGEFFHTNWTGRGGSTASSAYNA